MHQENRSPCNEVEISGSPWYTDLNGLPRVSTHFYFIPQGTYFPDDALELFMTFLIGSAHIVIIG